MKTPTISTKNFDAYLMMLGVGMPCFENKLTKEVWMNVEGVVFKVTLN